MNHCADFNDSVISIFICILYGYVVSYEHLSKVYRRLCRLAHCEPGSSSISI